MRAQINAALTLALLCCLISCTPVAALAQTPGNASSDPWDAVQATPSRTELEIQLDDGTKLKGRLLTATAEMLRLSLTDRVAEVQRSRVLKIYQLSPKPDEFRRMVRGAGAITGVAAGLEFATDRGVGFFILPAIGGTFGALGGYAYANRMKTRLLIYDAKPRQVTKSRSSKPDEPQAFTRPRTANATLQSQTTIPPR